MIKPMDWEALRRAFAPPAPSARLESEDMDGFALALDLDGERAAIMEYDGGLS